MTTAPNKKPPLKIIVDSNALFVPLKFKIDFFEETKCLLNRNVAFVILSPVKHELELLATKDSPKIRREADYALRLAEKCEFVAVEDCRETTDDAIVRVAKNWNSPVFTNDVQLRRRLRDISVPVIYVRQKSRLEIDGLI